MVVGVRDEAKNLLKLVDAVGSHNPRILVEIVRQPAQHTEKKGLEGHMAFVKAGNFSKTGREPGVSDPKIASRPVIGEHD